MNTEEEIVVAHEEVIAEPVVVQPSFFKQKLVRIGLSGFLLVLLTTSMILSDKLRYILLSQTKITTLFPMLQPQSPSPLPSPETKKLTELYTLLHMDGEMTATVAAIPTTIDHIANWNDLLFYPERTATQSTEIVAKNIRTLESTLIFSQPKNLSLDSLEVIDDTLVFSFGGYMKDGAQYIVPLTKEFSVKQIASIMSGTIIPNWHDRTWIIGGFGDGCANQAEYYLIDKISWTPRLVAQVNANCSNGEIIFGLDKRNRLLVGGYTNDNQIEPDLTYAYISSIHVNNPEVNEGIIAKQHMPANIKQLSYDPKSDAIILSTSTESFIYSLDTKETTQSASLKQDVAGDNPYKTRFSNFEDKIHQMKLPEGYVWEKQTL